MKLIKPIAKKLKKFLTAKKTVIGYVEHIESDRISGWAIHKQGGQIDLQLKIQGKLQKIHPFWSDRIDVAANHGQNNTRCGFEIILGDETKALLDETGNIPNAVEVFANNIPLPSIQLTKSQNTKASVKLVPESLGIEFDGSPDFSSVIESLGHFTLNGSLVLKNDSEIECDIECNGKPVACALLLQESSSDSSENASLLSKRYQFDIELPGYMWETISDDDVCKIFIRFNRTNINPEAIQITKKQLVAWINDIMQVSEGKEKQYRSLLALEHIYHAKLLPNLPKKSAQWIVKFAEKMHLGDLTLTDTKLEIEEIPSESPSTLLLWKALRSLNDRINDEKQPVFDNVEWVIKNLRLTGKDRDRFLNSVLPLLCKKNEFERLKGLINLSTFERMAKSNNVWEITLAIPLLISNHQVTFATETLYRAIEHTNKGWINTECIDFSVTLVDRLEKQLEITVTEAENFRYAVIALLDGFKGEWFSRLHDTHFVSSIATMIANIEYYSDYHRKDVIKAAIRIYGLNPAFWQCIDRLDRTGLDNELSLCRGYFYELQQILLDGSTKITGKIGTLFHILNYFFHKNNPETIQFLREIIANHAEELNGKSDEVNKNLIETLLYSSSMEAIRLAAFPLSEKNTLLSDFSNFDPPKLREIIRQATEQQKSTVAHIQEKACRGLEKLLSVHHSAQVTSDEIKDSLEYVYDNLVGLDGWQANFLAFDILSTAFVIASERKIDSHWILTRMEKLLHQSLSDTKPDWYLPPPIMVGLSRLIDRNRRVNDPLLQGFVNASQSTIRDHFSHSVSVLFKNDNQTELQTNSFGWPKDTLVVIYSCKKYLDSRVKTIRNTWVQNLIKRQIPYLILVGDGDDTVQGDVLALNVSDLYEDLPKKSLKLFDWVYHHTDVQYVLKIDDDCYLDVDKFFDTLSYRKHFYYGRVIRRAEGGTDRLWHQKKSHSEHGRKSLDKSPEPSIYADGGGGYTLSRPAIRLLLDSAKTDEGKRLIMNSFMEDKLVGDLLSLKKILPSNEDYESYQRRRTFDKAIPVAMVENTFFPSLSSPTKVTHLDTENGFEELFNKSADPELKPKKLWPTCWQPSIKTNTNQLELLSDIKKLKLLKNSTPVLIAVIRNEITLLPHFLTHYRKLGVECMVFVDNCSDDGSREFLMSQNDVVLFSSDTEYKHSHFGVAWQQAILGNYCMGKWVLLVDADEFLIFDECENRKITDLIEEIEHKGCDAACIYMVDMYPEGKLEEANFTINTPFEAAPMFDNPPVVEWHIGSGCYSNCPTTISHLRHRVVPNAIPNDFVSQKYALFKYNPWVRLSEGIHYASNIIPYDNPLWFSHFKYHAGFKEKVETEIKRKQHFNNAAEYNRYLSMLNESSGQFFNKKITIKYKSSKSFLLN